MKVLLIASDLDGTLLRSDKTISIETKNLLYALHEKGVLFVPSTGRSHTELPEAIRELSFLKYAITCNGGGVYDYDEGQYLFNYTIEKSMAKQVLEFCKKVPVCPTMVCEGERYIETDATGRISEFVRKIASPGILELATESEDLSVTLENIETEVQKIMLYPLEIDRREEILLELKKRFPGLAITTSGPMYIEVNAGGIDKGKTLNALCEHLKIPISHVVAFGDAGNDIAMLQAAGYAVVPKNGSEEAKKYADRFCETCDEDGVRKALTELMP